MFCSVMTVRCYMAIYEICSEKSTLLKRSMTIDALCWYMSEMQGGQTFVVEQSFSCTFPLLKELAEI